MLLAAANETGLIDALEAALPEDLPADNGRRHHKCPDSRRALLLTLLFLPAVGLKRARDLGGYTGDALALLTGRERAYSYRHTERFLSTVARAGGAETLTDALAEWTSKLWRPDLRPLEELAGTYYVDGHRKALHSDKLIPRGLVSRYGKVLGCRALILLHDEHGHPLLATSRAGLPCRFHESGTNSPMSVKEPSPWYWLLLRTVTTSRPSEARWARNPADMPSRSTTIRRTLSPPTARSYRSTIWGSPEVKCVSPRWVVARSGWPCSSCRSISARQPST
ncbi:MAG: hypothetical protein M3P51_12895, partial [Chloroflexota bacterium]|nr:hypothetical protein [Chloroflexota bacterium]